MGSNKSGGTDLSKVITDIHGLDFIADGRLRAGRTTLVSGTSGSAKTVCVCQFLVEGIRKANQPGVFVTFEEPAADLRKNVQGFGWDIEKTKADGMGVFVDASPTFSRDPSFAGRYDLATLLSRIEYAATKCGTGRVAIEPLSGIFPQLEDHSQIRQELLRYVETFVEIRRGLTLLKMGGSIHNKDSREFAIDGSGMHIGKPFRNVTRILAGIPTYTDNQEIERLGRMFDRSEM